MQRAEPQTFNDIESFENDFGSLTYVLKKLIRTFTSIKYRIRGLAIRYGESRQNSNNIGSTDFFFHSKFLCHKAYLLQSLASKGR